MYSNSLSIFFSCNVCLFVQVSLSIMEILRFYYWFYFLLACIQLLAAQRIAHILIVANRWKSTAFVATILILSINLMDVVTISNVLRLQYHADPDGHLWRVFWFGFRNLYLLIYWFRYALFLGRIRTSHGEV